MIYVYPKFSKFELPFVRIGGAGLGNLLFTYSRALIYANENCYKLIWPTWPSFKIGPYLRRELDKRFYGDLFVNNSGYVDGIEKFKILAFNKKINQDDVESVKDNDVVIFDKFKMNFEGIKKYRDVIRDDLIKNLSEKNKKALDFDFTNSISVHIRLGDFGAPSVDKLKRGCNNTSIPIEWYVKVILQIRKIIGRDIKVYVFSDGSDEQLDDVLKLINVEKITFGTSIADIIALSRSNLFIASGSSFSMWARFLGNLSTITYTNQLKDKICDENGFEFETDNACFTSEMKESIIRLLK